MGQVWCRFASDGRESAGLVADGCVEEVDGTPFGAYRKTGRRSRLEDVKLLPPVYPGTFYADGSNYRNNVMAKGKGETPKFPDAPHVGYRANSALIGTDDAIVKPADAGPHFQYECELVAVIGKTAKNVSAKEAEACIFGWTIGNDLTERTWHKSDVTNIRSKNSDTFKPMGPWIVTGVPLESMVTRVRLNGELVHSFPTGNMLFGPGEVISVISRYNTLHPGDVVWLGTDEQPRDLNPGDVIEAEITGIGMLRNTVVAG